VDNDDDAFILHEGRSNSTKVHQGHIIWIGVLLDPELEVQTNLGQPPGSHGACARPKRHGLCQADDSNHDPEMSIRHEGRPSSRRPFSLKMQGFSKMKVRDKVHTYKHQIQDPIDRNNTMRIAGMAIVASAAAFASVPCSPGLTSSRRGAVANHKISMGLVTVCFPDVVDSSQAHGEQRCSWGQTD
jgi:hypothetical protein